MYLDVRSRDGGYGRETGARGGYDREKAGGYPGEYGSREHRDGGYGGEIAGARGVYDREKAGGSPREYGREYRDGGYGREKAGARGGYDREKAGGYPGEYGHREHIDGGYGREKAGIHGGYDREKAGGYTGEYVRERRNGGYGREKAGGYSGENREPKNHLIGKELLDLLPKDRRVEYVVTKVEEYVHKREHKVPSMENEKLKDYREREDKVPKGADLDENRRNNPLKISKWWKNEDKGNKYNGGGLERKEPPAIVTDGGWTRPNRAMWASPPSGHESEETISDALNYLRLAGAKGGDPDNRYRSTGAGLGRARPDDRVGKAGGRVSVPPKDVDKALDYLRDAGRVDTGKATTRLTVAVPMSPTRDGYREKPPVREIDGYRGTIDSRDRGHGGTRV